MPTETRFRLSESGGLRASVRAGPSVGRRSRDVACEVVLGRAVDAMARAEVPKPPRLHRGGFTVFAASAPVFAACACALDVSVSVFMCCNSDLYVVGTSKPKLDDDKLVSDNLISIPFAAETKL